MPVGYFIYYYLNFIFYVWEWNQWTRTWHQVGEIHFCCFSYFAHLICVILALKKKQKQSKFPISIEVYVLFLKKYIFNKMICLSNRIKQSKRWSLTLIYCKEEETNRVERMWLRIVSFISPIVFRFKRIQRFFFPRKENVALGPHVLLCARCTATDGP